MASHWGAPFRGWDDANLAEYRVRERLAAGMASGRKDAYQEAMGISLEIQDLLHAGGEVNLREKMPTEWLREMAVFGEPEDCARTLENLATAGADSIVLVPLMHKEISLKTYLPRLLKHLGR